MYLINQLIGLKLKIGKTGNYIYAVFPILDKACYEETVLPCYCVSFTKPYQLFPGCNPSPVMFQRYDQQAG